eukprot:TRINITY_DN13078_c0_g1_i1.p1 TRINITY_DN13078_c0_g1~~TRINITY_DN13078_c0_g1_i1.p1  ORF type:complete len:325 (-),score=38.36 TRINITY_DN13078_c0_g1_i1:79-1053(-)
MANFWSQLEISLQNVKIRGVDLATTLAVLGWFFFNIAIANVNKWIFTNYTFQYPVFLTTLHMVTALIFSSLVKRLGWYPMKELTSWTKWYKKILPLAFIFCASVASGNLGLKYIFVSYAQIVTATTPLFTVLAMYFLTYHNPKWDIWLSMVPIVGGVSLASWQEADFNIFGFAAVIFATALRAVKSVWQGQLLTDEEDKLDPISLLYYMSPPSVVMLFFLTLLFEPEIILDTNIIMANATDSSLLFWVFMSGTIAFWLNIMNLLVTKYTSALTLQVLGNVKVVLSIIVSVLIFQNRVSFLAWVGCVITLLGGQFYSTLNKRNKP